MCQFTRSVYNVYEPRFVDFTENTSQNLNILGLPKTWINKEEYTALPKFKCKD